MQPETRSARIALVTAAYNEERVIENTILSIVAQTHPPVRWVIVSDGSTDRTDAIVTQYASRHPFIQLHRLTKDHPRNFAAQANAINAGLAQIVPAEFDFIGNLDADITFEPRYFERLLGKFALDPNLGLAGGLIYEKDKDGVFRSRPDNSVTSVAHAVQLFRRECFEAIGAGYAVLPYGGPDTYAEVCARMRGWKVASSPDVEAHHHRATGSAGGPVRSCFRQGRMDRSLGTWPLFELMKVLRRLLVSPYLIGAAARFAGFLFAYAQGEKPVVSGEFVTFYRHEQKARLASLLGSRPPQQNQAPSTVDASRSPQ